MKPDHASAIKAEAKRLGFCLAGIARADELTPEGDRLRDWLAKGYHAGMGWMEGRTDRRTDPRLIVEGARSVVSVAMNYAGPGRHSDAPGAVKISRYAWGDDYHDVMGDRLSRLESFISTLEPGTISKAYVDTGPVMDKAWASRAGIGWLGKNTNVLTRSHGSWVFLGSVITTLECEPDRPETDMCGTCTACLDACPTGAFPQPYVLDSSKCISYLTIEHRGEFSDDVPTSFDGWIFGCDVCQDVCPWNRFAQDSTEPAFAPKAGMVDPDPEELANLTEREFSERFRRSALWRTKLTGLKRNIRHIRESSG